MFQDTLERYLAQLGRQLKLSRRERASITDELRDHFEERLAGLLAAGETPARAVELALSEFGDAADLAAEFRAVLQQQRRRRIMRMTAGTVGLAATVTWMTMLFWPGVGQGPAVPHVMADQADVSDTAPAKAATSQEMDAQTRSKLEQRVEGLYPDVPLDDVLEDLSIRYDLQFYIRRLQLEELGVDLKEETVQLNLEEIRLDMLLELLLDEAGLTYIIRDGLVIITTLDDVETISEVRVYNCRDLLGTQSRPAGVRGFEEEMMGAGMAPRAGPSGMPGMGSSMSSMGGMGMDSMPGGGWSGGTTSSDELIEIITSSVASDSWAEMGGSGSIGAFRGLLVVNHNPRVHIQVKEVLDMLRKASHEAPGAMVGP